MVDQSDKRSDGGEVNNNNNNKYPEGACSEESQASEIKRCADCGTSKTPLWRGGPAGPKSLCNACGIRSRKKRRAILGLKPENEKKSKKSSSCNNSNSNNSSGSTSSSPTATATTTKSSKMGSPLHQRLIALGREVMMQKSTADKQYRRRKLGEEEQAAVLLMALSYGSVFA